MNDWPYPWIPATEIDKSLRERLDVGDEGVAMSNDHGVLYILGDGSGEYMNMANIPHRLENHR